ncbi:hypothetical protein HIM_06226 [Hirsutella minnesotensis 3608]|uniref:O-methyltransferase domain-containing protein n=1 Tax=Hirsutella minnesotensis 3608 TaxID=1043627 RepID=A0A0F7ZJH4_9HYPO|nr:hypothetical protein HIM_06226 [Hirsutella minnesotensis 3608]
MGQVAVQDTLEALRVLINSSIDAVQQDLAARHDPALNLQRPQRHPLRDRRDSKVSRALKSLSSAGLMLRALTDPNAWLLDIAFNYTDLTALFVACQADVANLLKDGPMNAKAMAKAAGIDAGKLSRVLRALCNMHIFHEVEADVYQNNEISTLLQSESGRALVGFCAEDGRMMSRSQWEALTRPDFRDSHDMRKAAFNIAYETDLNFFESTFTVYPWAEVREGSLIVDVGGGIGGATLPIVNQFKSLQLKIQDLAENSSRFSEFLEAQYPDVAASGRASFQEQDFFEKNQQPGADVYFMRHIILNWPDAQAVTLLGNIAEAMSSSSKLLICEHVALPSRRQGGGQDDTYVAPEPLLPNWGAGFTSRLDLQVLASINARRRIEADYAALATRAGLELVRVWRNFGEEVIMEMQLANAIE